MKKLLIGAAMAGVTALTGCASVDPIPDTVVPLATTDKVFEYKQDMPTGETLSAQRIVTSVGQQIIKSSGVRTVEETAEHIPSSSYDVRGLKVDGGQDKFDVSFIRGQQFHEGGRIYGTFINATYGVSTETLDGRVRVSITTPSEYVIKHGRDPVGSEYSPLCIFWPIPITDSGLIRSPILELSDH